MDKNKALKILFFLMVSLKGVSQINFATNQISNPNVLPPNVSSFQKVNFLPVSNYTGRANVEIPFYEIDLGGLKIPVHLSYNTGGVKPNDVASSVGLNWSLNAGGMISKTVEGIDDFYNDYNVQQGNIQGGVDGEYYEKRIGFMSYYANHLAEVGFPGSEDSPDYFNVNAPGVNFSYIHNRGKLDYGQNPYGIPPGSFTQNPSQFGSYSNQMGQNVNLADTAPWDLSPFILNSSNDYKINETYGDISLGMYGVELSANGGGFYNRFWVDNNGYYNPNYSRYGVNSISIQNQNGFQYIFDKIDSSQYVLNRNEDVTNETVTYTYNQLVPPGTYKVNFSTNVNLVTYHLSKIIDLKTNKSIEFQYQNYSQSFSEIIDNSVTSNVTYNPKVKGLWQKYPKINRLVKIIFDKGYINFNYNLNRDDLPGEKALTEIILYDNKNNQIKKAILNFGYFQSINHQTSPFSKRLKLIDVTFQGNDGTSNEKYKLSYNSTPLPLRSLALTDFFGYNNGSANFFQYDIVNNEYVVQVPNTSARPNPTIYFHPNNGQNSFLPVKLNPNAIEIGGNYSLESNINFCKAGILERIDYPTGGYTMFDYGLNSFKINNYEIQGGGLRIDKQIISDGNRVKTLKFEYNKIDNTSSGAIASMSKFIDFDYNYNNNAPLQSSLPTNLTPAQFNSWFAFSKYNYSKQNIELTNGCFVGYSRVKEYEEGNGYKLYEYTNPSTHPNEQANAAFTNYSIPITPTAYSNINNYKKILYDNGKLSLFIDNDLFRGKLLKESIFNSQNLLLRETNYLYTEKLYKSTLLFKLLENIKSESNCLIDPDAGGSWCQSFQYGFAKQRRYLLNNTVEKEYLSGITKVTTKDYVHDDNYSLVKTETTTNNLDTFRNEYYYPFDSGVQGEYGIPTLNLNNRNFEKIKTLSFKNNEKLLEEKIQYGSFTQYGYLWPKKVVKYKSGSLNNTDEIKSAEVTVRDEFGNICELTDVLGNKTSFIWGYNKTEIVAQIENVAYGTIQSGIISSIQTASNTGTENELLNQLNNLRSTLSTIPNTMISTFTYKPLIGVSTITDVKKDRITYEYDNFGRLKAVRDKNNNILSENEYHLKPQN